MVTAKVVACGALEEISNPFVSVIGIPSLSTLPSSSSAKLLLDDKLSTVKLAAPSKASGQPSLSLSVSKLSGIPSLSVSMQLTKLNARWLELRINISEEAVIYSILMPFIGTFDLITNSENGGLPAEPPVPVTVILPPEIIKLVFDEDSISQAKPTGIVPETEKVNWSPVFILVTTLALEAEISIIWELKVIEDVSPVPKGDGVTSKLRMSWVSEPASDPIETVVEGSPISTGAVSVIALFSVPPPVAVVITTGESPGFNGFVARGITEKLAVAILQPSSSSNIPSLSSSKSQISPIPSPSVSTNNGCSELQGSHSVPFTNIFVDETSFWPVVPSPLVPGPIGIPLLFTALSILSLASKFV